MYVRVRNKDGSTATSAPRRRGELASRTRYKIENARNVRTCISRLVNRVNIPQLGR